MSYKTFGCCLSPAQVKTLQLAMKNKTMCQIMFTYPDLKSLMDGDDDDAQNNIWICLTDRQVKYVDDAYNNEQGKKLAFSVAQVAQMAKLNKFDETPAKTLLARKVPKPAEPIQEEEDEKSKSDNEEDNIAPVESGPVIIQPTVPPPPKKRAPRSKAPAASSLSSSSASIQKGRGIKKNETQ